MLPVNKTQKDDHYHQNKSSDQIWSFRDDVCKFESQKAMKCVVYHDIKYLSKAHPHSHVHNTLQPCQQLTIFRVMTISIKIKEMIKFGASETMYVDLRAKKLWNV